PAASAPRTCGPRSALLKVFAPASLPDRTDRRRAMRRIAATALGGGGGPLADALVRARRRDAAWVETDSARPWPDPVNADGAVLLGWNDPGVEAAAAEPRPDAAAEAAARLAARLPGVEAVCFTASVAAALAATLLAARALTGRDGAFFCDEACAAADD